MLRWHSFIVWSVRALVASSKMDVKVWQKSIQKIIRPGMFYIINFSQRLTLETIMSISLDGLIYIEMLLNTRFVGLFAAIIILSKPSINIVIKNNLLCISVMHYTKEIRFFFFFCGEGEGAGGGGRKGGGGTVML